jgi:predicted ATPase
MLYGAAHFHHVRNDHERALSLAIELRRAAASYQLSNYGLFAEILVAGGLAATGRTEEGIVALTSVTDMLRRAAAAIWLPQVLLLRAEAYRKSRKLEEARQSLQDAFATAARSGGTLFDAEMHRLDGELAFETDRDGRDTAEAAYHRALAISRQQGAKLWELRAAMSLGRIWQSSGRRGEARSLVSDTYARFTEGFDTPDVAAARGFLEVTA